MLEIANRTDVPVIQGAEFPLLNNKGRRSEATELKRRDPSGSTNLSHQKLAWWNAPVAKDLLDFAVDIKVNVQVR